MKIKLTAKPGTSSQVKTGNWRDMYYPEVDKEKCIGCGMCERVCPEGVCFATGEKNSKGRNIYDCDLDYCKGCGICAEECPTKAILMKEEKK
ncbi:MAG: 4Fe-4S binding protein [Candidatus Buchananbacteria bacterium]